MDGKFHNISEVISHKHKGKIFRITTKCFGTTCLTEEHPVYVAKREDPHKKLHNKKFDAQWVRTDQIQLKDYLLYPILKEVKDLEYIEVDYNLRKKDTVSKVLPAKISLTSDFLRLMGYYIAEGYVAKRAINFIFNSKEAEFILDVEAIMLDIFGLKAAKSTKRNATTLSFYSAPLGRIFLEWFGHMAYNKKIPHFAMLLPTAKQKELIKGLWRGDGWVNTKQLRGSLKTTSKILTEQLKIFLLRQGLVPIITVNKAYGIHKESYNIQIVNDRDFAILCKIMDNNFKFDINKTTSPSSVLTPDYVLMPVKKIEIFDYDGLVYNLEVDDVNSYVSQNAILHNCGDFGILLSVKQALVEMDLDIKDVLIVTGIGCSGKFNYWIKTYGFNGLHGRPIPVATGAKLANHKLTVVAVSGDGDAYSEGGNHFLHAMRRNLDMTYIVHNNQVYGLTTGQASPTSDKGYKSKSTPTGVIEKPFDPLSIAIASGASYVARGFSGDINHLKKLIIDGVNHKGFALIDVLQPCITFNHVNTFDFFRQRIYKLEEKGHDPTNKEIAFKKSLEWGDKIPIGLFYKEEYPIYEEQLPQVTVQPLVKHDLYNINITKLMNDFD